jgi:hypothetical protein
MQGTIVLPDDQRVYPEGQIPLGTELESPYLSMRAGYIGRVVVLAERRDVLKGEGWFVGAEGWNLLFSAMASAD